jgi:ParB family chromosome partitioning protein
MDDQQALELALSENLDRKDLNPIEVLDSLLQLLVAKLQMGSEKSVRSLIYDMKRDWETQRATKKAIETIKDERETGNNCDGDIDIPDPSHESQQIVARVFKQYGYNWYSYTCNQLKLRDLPDDLYDAIARGKIEYSKGLRFKSIKDATLRSELLERAIQEGWSQREIQQQIKERTIANEEPPTQIAPQYRLNVITNRLKKSKLWQSHPKEWKKIESRLQFIEDLLIELDKSSGTVEN